MPKIKCDALTDGQRAFHQALLDCALDADADATGLTEQEILAVTALFMGKLMWLGAMRGWTMPDLQELVSANTHKGIMTMLERDDLDTATIGALRPQSMN